MTLFVQVRAVLLKDVRRWAPLIAAVVGALAFWRVRAGQSSSGDDGFLGWGITVALAWGLVGLVILDDPPIGDRAFWKTRPVSPLATFLAKASFLFVLLVLLPTAVQTHWLASVWPGAWRDFWLGSIVTQSALVGLAILAATLSRGWARYLAIGGIGLLLTVTFFEGWVFSVLPSVVLLFFAALLTTGLAGWQYLQRRTAVVGGCGLVMIAALPVAPFHSGPPLVQLLVPSPDRVTDYADADSVVLSVQTMGLQSARYAFLSSRSRPALWGELTVQAPGEVVAIVREVEGRLIPSGWPRSFYPLDESGGDAVELGSPRFGYRNLATAERDRGWAGYSQFDLFWGEAQEIDRRLGESTGFKLRVAADLYKAAVRGRLELKPGAELRTPRGSFTVESVDRLSGRLLVRTSSVGPAWNFFWEESKKIPILLVNPAREEFVKSISISGQQLFTGLVPSLQWLGLHQSIRFDLPADLPDGWLEGAELQVLGMDYLGSVERTLTREVEEWPGWGRHVAVDWVPMDPKIN